MNFDDGYYYDDDPEEISGKGFVSGVLSWWNNSKNAWRIAKNISPVAFVLSILFTASGLVTSTLGLIVVGPILAIIKSGTNLQQVFERYAVYLIIGLVGYAAVLWLKPHAIMYLKRTFKHVKVRQELFIKDVLLHVPYVFSIDSSQEYKVHRFTSLVEGIFSVAKEQAEMVISLFTIIVGLSVGSQLDFGFLVFMAASAIFSAVVTNRRKMKNLMHANEREEGLLWGRVSDLSQALNFPSLSTHLSNQLHTVRGMFAAAQEQQVDRGLAREEHGLMAEQKSALFDLVMKLGILGYILYSVKQGRMLDVVATYYVASQVSNAISSFGAHVVDQNEISQKLSFVGEIMHISDEEKAKDAARIIPDSSRGIEIELCNVSFQYPGEKSFVFLDLNLKISLDAFFGLEGANGNGKTTLFKLITGYLSPTTGSISINGIPVERIKRRWFSDTFANYSPEMHIVPMMTVEEFLTVDGLALPFPERLHTMRRILAEVGLEDKFASRDIQTTVLDPGHPDGTDLSSGQQQRLLIARMIMNLIAGAQYVLADEMTSNIAFGDQSRLIAVLRRYAKGGIVIAHNPNMIEACDEVLTCKGGTVTKTALNSFIS